MFLICELSFVKVIKVPKMILYNVTVNVDQSIHADWLEWMRNSHIPEVMKTGFFNEYRILKVLSDEDTGPTYSIQYFCDTMEKYENYELNFAPKLRDDVIGRYKEKFIAFRTLLEVIE